MIVKIIEGFLPTKCGDFVETVFTDGQNLAICLSIGNISGVDPLLVRIHSHCISSHVFFYTGCDCSGQMYRSQEAINRNGSGIIIWLDQEGRSNGHVAKIASELWKKKGLSQTDAYIAAGYIGDAREYGLAIKIIDYYAPKSIHLLTSNPWKLAAVKTLNVATTSEGI